MSSSYKVIYFFVIFFCSNAVFADASVEVLLNKGTTPADKTPEAGLQSGRYQKKKNIPSEEIVYGTKKPASVEVELVDEEGDDDSDSKSLQTTVPPTVPPVKEPTLKEQAKDLLIKGGANKTGSAYRDQIHPDDIRNNKVEIDFSSGVYYNNSEANIAYRKYYSMASHLSVGARIWLTPLIGISGKYIGTFGEDIASATTPANRVAVKSEWTELSFDLRTFFGLSRRANSLSYGLYYKEYFMDVSSSEVSRIKLKSSGLGLYLGGRFPTAPSYAWIFGGEVVPVLAHKEAQTALNYSSGGSNSASLVGVYFGGEIKFSRQQQIIWTLGAKMERNQFNGVASLADPMTGAVPNGVSVTNSWAVFNLGYRWGQ